MVPIEELNRSFLVAARSGLQLGATVTSHFVNVSLYVEKRQRKGSAKISERERDMSEREGVVAVKRNLW